MLTPKTLLTRLNHFMPNLIYLPNVYVHPYKSMRPAPRKLITPGVLNVGCFGAIRPMKNQLSQAMAALKFCRSLGLRLRFHVNSSRSEAGGDPVLKNLRALSDGEDYAELVECGWLELEDLVLYFRNELDIGMQVSMSETFNFVAANYVTAGIPMVVSKQIKWASRFSQTKDDSIDEIIRCMKRAWNWRCLISRNQKLLDKASHKAAVKWVEVLG